MPKTTQGGMSLACFGHKEVGAGWTILHGRRACSGWGGRGFTAEQDPRAEAAKPSTLRSEGSPHPGKVGLSKGGLGGSHAGDPHPSSNRACASPSCNSHPLPQTALYLLPLRLPHDWTPGGRAAARSPLYLQLPPELPAHAQCSLGTERTQE